MLDMRSPLEIMAQFLQHEGWPYEQVGEQMLLRTKFAGSHGEWICYALCQPEGPHYLFYSVAPKRAPAVLRPAVAEYVTRANWGLLNGNFELDYADGEVRFRSSIQLPNTPATNDLLHPLVYGSVAMMELYLPGLEAVMALSMTPLEAINAVEAKSGS
jgi:hypothetical protein